MLTATCSKCLESVLCPWEICHWRDVLERMLWLQSSRGWVRRGRGRS